MDSLNFTHCRTGRFTTNPLSLYLIAGLIVIGLPAPGFAEVSERSAQSATEQKTHVRTAQMRLRRLPITLSATSRYATQNDLDLFLNTLTAVAEDIEAIHQEKADFDFLLGHATTYLIDRITRIEADADRLTTLKQITIAPSRKTVVSEAVNKALPSDLDSGSDIAQTVMELKSVGIDLTLADGTFQANQPLTYEDYETYLSLIEPAIVHTLYGLESADSLEDTELIASQTDSPPWSEASDMLRELREEIEQAEALVNQIESAQTSGNVRSLGKEDVEGSEIPLQHSSKDSPSDDSFYTVLQSLEETFGLTILETLQDEGRLNADAALTRGEFATYLLEAYVSLGIYAEDDSGEQLLTTNDPWRRSYENGIASLRARLQIVVRQLEEAFPQQVSMAE